MILEHSISWTVTTATHPIHTVSDSVDLFARCEAIASLPEDMVSTAERGNWGEVSLLERECVTHMERLGHGLRPVLSHEEIQRKRDLMMCTLANDARMCVSVCPRRDELMCLVSGERHAIGAH